MIVQNFRDFLNTYRYIIIFMVFTILSLFFLAKYITNQRKIAQEIIASKTDSVRVITQQLQDTIFLNKYAPKEVIHDTITRIVQIPTEFKPTDNDEENKKRLAALSEKYFNKKTYGDVIKLKDSSGLEVGSVNIEDIISENSIFSRGVNYQLKFPKETITKTTTNTIKEQPKRKVLTGLEATYTNITPLNSAGVALMYQDKQNRLYKVSAGQMFSTKTQYVGIGYYTVLSFRKK